MRNEEHTIHRRTSETARADSESPKEAAARELAVLLEEMGLQKEKRWNPRFRGAAGARLQGHGERMPGRNKAMEDLLSTAVLSGKRLTARPRRVSDYDASCVTVEVDLRDTGAFLRVPIV